MSASSYGKMKGDGGGIESYEVKTKKVKTKTIGTLLIAGLVMFSAMVVFATPAMASHTDEDFENAPPIAENELEPANKYPDPPEGETRDDPEWYGQITNANLNSV